MAKQKNTNVITGLVRLSYANVWEPKSINGGDPRYSCSIIITHPSFLKSAYLYLIGSTDIFQYFSKILYILTFTPFSCLLIYQAMLL